MIIFGVITLGLIAWGLWIATYNDTPAPTQPTRHDDDTYDYPNYTDAAGYNQIARRQAVANAMTDAELISILREHQSLIRDEVVRTEVFGNEAVGYRITLKLWHGRIDHWVDAMVRESWPIDPDDKHAEYIAKAQVDKASNARTSARRWITHPAYAFLWITPEGL